MTEKLRVLLVDDDDVDRESILRALQRADVEFEVEEARDVASGLAKLTTGIFDCAIVDYLLPDGDAMDFLDARDIIGEVSGESSKQPPIVILTGHGNEKVAAEFLKAGASDYLPKSDATPNRLVRSVRRATRVARMEEKTAQALERLHQAEVCCQYLFDQFPEALMVTRPDGKLLDANPAACRLYHTKLEDLVGRSFSDWSPPAERQTAQQQFRTRTENETAQWEGVVWLSEGSSVPVSLSSKRTVRSGQPAVILRICPSAP